MEHLIDKDALVAEIERRIKTNKECMLGLRNLDYYQGKVDALNDTLSFIDSMQEEPTDKDFEAALAEEWKSYNDRGAAKVDALEDNTQELAFAKGFYRGWHYMDDEGLRKAVEGVSEELSNYINELSKQFQEVSFAKLSRIAVRVAKWQKDSLWKPADGDDLPEIDREVIALLDNGKVVYAHRPPEYWDGKNIITGKVTRYYPKTYDKGGWNIPNVKYWLDCLLPNMED